MDFVNKAKESMGSNSNNQQQQGGAAPAQGQQGNAGQEDYSDKGMFPLFCSTIRILVSSST